MRIGFFGLIISRAKKKHSPETSLNPQKSWLGQGCGYSGMFFLWHVFDRDHPIRFGIDWIRLKRIRRIRFCVAIFKCPVTCPNIADSSRRNAKGRTWLKKVFHDVSRKCNGFVWNVCEMQKRKLEVVRCINEWANCCLICRWNHPKLTIWKNNCTND